MITTSYFRAKTETINSILSDRVDNGLFIKDLAKKYKLSEATINNILFFYGISKIQCETRLKFIKLLKKDLKLNEIANRLGFTNEHTIYIKIHKLLKKDPEFKRVYLDYKQRKKDEKRAVWNEIIIKYKSGCKVPDLALEYSYSEERIHQILRGAKNV